MNDYEMKECLRGTIARLKQTGIIAWPSFRSDTLLFVDSRTNKVTNAIVFRPDSLFNAFSTGDFMLNDNFDKLPGQVPVENCTFGACKLLLEEYCWNQVLQRVDPAFPDKEFDDLIEAMGKNYFKMHTEVIFWAGKIGKKDPRVWEEDIVKVAQEIVSRNSDIVGRIQSIGALSKTLPKNDPGLKAQVWDIVMSEGGYQSGFVGPVRNQFDVKVNFAQKYLAANRLLLPHLASCNQRIAKMAVGRNALYPLIGKTWDALAEDAVYFARRSILAHNTEVAFLFCLVHKFALTTEVSKDDVIWACKVEPLQEDLGPLDSFKRENDGLPFYDEFGPIWVRPIRDNNVELLRIMQEAPSKKLGRVNHAVAMDLMQVTSSFVNRSTSQQILRACQWDRWFGTYAYPGHYVFNTPPFQPELLKMLHDSTLDQAKMALRLLHSSL